MTALRQRTEDRGPGTAPAGAPKRVLIIWGNWGPYHYARFRAFREKGREAGYDVQGLELFSSSGYYDWQVARDTEGMHHLNIGPVESEFHPWRMTKLALPKIVSIRPDVVFVPSYWPWSLYVNFLSRLIGARIVMMNESHAGTEKATGWKRLIKKLIVRSFHAAFVGGAPQKEHFASMGLRSDRIFPGYDAIDNEYFGSMAAEARSRKIEWREKLGLPGNYFLSLGRMVEKKNLPLLIEAYARFLDRNPDADQHLVFVGSGDEEPRLRELCAEMKLPVVNHRSQAFPLGEISASGESTHVCSDAGRRSPASDACPVRAGSAGTNEKIIGSVFSSHATFASDLESTIWNTEPDTQPSVHFFGFRQIQENPIFYALADAFVLPSHTEEWGLVVNEAMACGLPVLVSRDVGCAHDLVETGGNGFLYDPSSPEELADHLGTLARQPDRRTEMGRKSLERIAHWGCDNFARNGIRAADASLKKP